MTVKSRMGANKVKEENKHRNKIVSRIKTRKPLFSFVPRFELFIKAFDEIV